MVFYNEFRKIIELRLKKRDSVKGLVRELNMVPENSKIGFYPAGRLSREIIDEIKNYSPNLLLKVVGCFDESEKATTSEGINVYSIKELDKILGKGDFLVSASNTFYNKEERDLKEIIGDFLKERFRF